MGIRRSSGNIVSDISLTKKIARELFDEERNSFDFTGKKEPVLQLYEYSTIKYTIRLKRGRPVFRICDIYLMATESVFRALCRKMFRHFLGREKRSSDERLFKAFLEHPRINERWKEIKIDRGRGKKITKAKGKVHDLNQLLREVRDRYFDKSLKLPKAGWSKIEAVRRFGHYDKLYGVIVISKTLDSAKVPAWVVKFVLYHELLHLKHGIERRGGRRRIHTPAFKRDEKRYERYEEAEAFLSDLSIRKASE